MLMAMANGNKYILLAKQQDKASNHSKTESRGQSGRMDVRNKRGSDVERSIGRKHLESIGRGNDKCSPERMKLQRRSEESSDDSLNRVHDVKCDLRRFAQ
jgi:hypothetical protein